MPPSPTWPHEPPPGPPTHGPGPAPTPPPPPYGGMPRPHAGPAPYGPPVGYWPPTAPPVGPPPAPPPRRRSAALTVLAAVLSFVVLMAGTVAVVSSLVSPTDPLTTRQGPSRQARPPLGVPTTPAPTGPGAGTDPDWDQVASAVTPGVVNIVTRVSGGVGAGTGMVLTADGQILTNNHVIEEATTIAVTTVVDGRSYRASVVGADPSHDIAVLALAGASGLATIPIGDSDTVQVGDPVVAIGNAGGRGGAPDVAPGSVIGLDQLIVATDANGTNAETLRGMIRVAADVQPGDSGGPLADAAGRAVGVNTAASAGRSRYRTADNQGFAIPINQALDIAHQLAAGGSPAPATLGVQVVTATGGAQVLTVEPSSPADRAGVAAGDLVTAIDGQEIRSADDLVEAIRAHTSGDSVRVGWTGADGRRHLATILLA